MSLGSSFMRHLLVLFVLGLIAAGCQSDTADSAAETAVEPTSQGARTEQSPNPDGGATPTAPAADVTNDAEPDTPSLSGCGFGADMGADRIEVEQIPGDGRGSGPSALTDLVNDAFDEPLVDVSRILSGGPPPDGIPPIDAPVFQTPATVDWLRCNEPVLSLSVDGESRAYPVQIMTWHELVNDTFGDVPVTVSYCPLCNSALAYRRDLDGQVVTFGTSGRLFNSSLVMYDRETESLWTHFNGTAVVGALLGTKLELLPMQTTSWQSFLQAHPDGLVLTRETGFDRRYGQNPYPGYDNVTSSPFLFDGDVDSRLAAKQRVVGIRRGGDSVAIPLEAVATTGVIETEVGGEVVSVWHLAGTATALEQAAIADGRDVGATGVYVPLVDGRMLTFGAGKGDSEYFTDAETGSSWNIQGMAVDGELSGAQLPAVEHLDTFWFALAAFEPDTRVVES